MGGMNESVREKILKAANRIIGERGLHHFTLDHVAQEASVSKGGLLYHFPSKDALIKGMIDQLQSRFDEKTDERIKEVEAPLPYDYLLTFIFESFEQIRLDPNVMAGMLAAVAMNQDLLASVKEFYEKWQAIMEQTADPVMATIIRLATDGLALTELFDVGALSEDMRKAVLDRLLKIAEENCKK